MGLFCAAMMLGKPKKANATSANAKTIHISDLISILQHK
jgi:hypothetical protein